MAETTWQTNTEDNGASTKGPEHHQPVSSQYKGSGPTVKGIQRAWFGWGGGKGVYIWFPAMISFGNISCWDGILPKRSNKWLGPSNACHRARQWGRGIQQEQKKREFFREMSSGAANMYWAMAGATNGWVSNLERMPTTNQKQLVKP